MKYNLNSCKLRNIKQCILNQKYKCIIDNFRIYITIMAVSNCIFHYFLLHERKSIMGHSMYSVLMTKL